ncbi:MAG: class I SAM-dependent methyltransferase [Acidobacteriota bacterium]
MPTEQPPARFDRIRAVGFDYANQPKHLLDACSFCGGQDLVVLAHRDRYGFPARAWGCRRCGLVFLNPVMTRGAYKDFYAEVYRPLVSAYHGRLIDAQSIKAEQRVYAAERMEFVAPFLDKRDRGTLLDIGGSTGVVANAFCSRFGLAGTVIDPSPLELAEAARLGLDTVAGMAEEYQASGRRFDVVLMCQTVDHLLDIRSTLAAIRGLLSEHGLFFVDFVDFRAAYLRNWSVEAAIKIDHPYSLTEPTFRAFLRRAGLEVLRTDYAADRLHIGMVCQPGPADVAALPAPDEPAALLSEVRYVQNAVKPS